MKIGIIGAGSMGSNLAICLSKKDVELGLYNRSKSKAEELSKRVNAEVYNSVPELFEKVEAAVAFLPGDYEIREVVLSMTSSKEHVKKALFINASTITPRTSLEIKKILETNGVHYVEAPVFGSTGEARECNLISLVSTSEEVFENAFGIINLYSSKIYYAGPPPSAMVVKLALNNLALSLPALMAESLMLLSSWGVEPSFFKRVVEETWLEPVLRRYWSRVFDESPPRFKTIHAGKDFRYVSSSLKDKGLPSFISDAISTMYYLASANGYGDKDYPQVAKYFYELGRKHTIESE